MATIDEVVLSSRSGRLDTRRLADWETDGGRVHALDGLGVEGAPLLEDAETCMRASGLWPWPE